MRLIKLRWKISMLDTVEPRYDAPIFNKVLDITSNVITPSNIIISFIYPSFKNICNEFTYIYIICVPFRGTNMATRNQQKHLFLSFPTYA